MSDGSILRLPFAKMHGAGNDFVMVRAEDLSRPLETADIAGLCDRRKAHAHAQGQGVCLDPKVVVEATAGGGISGAVSTALTSGKSAVLVPKATFQEQVSLGELPASRVGIEVESGDALSSPNRQRSDHLRRLASRYFAAPWA